jgi:hypothetical protein
MRRRKSPLDEEQHILRQIEIVQKRLQHLELQKARFGSFYVPPQMQLELEEETANLAYLRRRLTIIRQHKKKYYLFYRIADVLTKGIETFRKITRRTRRRKKKLSPITTLMIGLLSGFLVFLCAWLLFFRESAVPAIGQSFIEDPGSIAVPSNNIPENNSISNLESGGEAYIANTGGIGVRLRIEPRQDAVSFFDLPENATVILLEVNNSEAEGRWWLVDIGNGQLGYIHERHLKAK